MPSTKKSVRRVEKPWGYELIWGETKDYVGKLLHIKKDHKLSLQYHEVKEETIYVQSGKMLFLFEDDHGKMLEVTLLPGEAHHIPTGRKHRMIAIEDCDVFEVSTPHLNDVVRLEDAYARVK
ncbi:MAG: cupin domain-containing protein [Bdellovibrionales bacterium]|nr:cupin domain-containing protein [Bdellovibrionales bacterium]